MLTMAVCAVALGAPGTVPWAAPRDVGEVRLAIVGSLPAAPYTLIDAVKATRPDILVFTGLSRSDDLTHWPTDGGVLARTDGPLNRPFLERFDGADPYGAVDLVVGGTRWRVVTVTTSDRPTSRWEEQGYWLPKALDPSAYDRLIVLSDAPRHTLTGAPPSGGARVLLDRVQDAADPMSFALWIAGNRGSNEVFAPGGAFGELHLVAGASGGRHVPYAREGRVMPGVMGRERQEPAWDTALSGWYGELPDAPEVPGPEGFWVLELDGPNATLDFHRLREGAWVPDFRLIRDRRGWHVP